MSTHGARALSVQEAAARAGVAPATLRRWRREGLIPNFNGAWSPGAVGHARIVARLRERGHWPLVDVAGPKLEFERITEIRLKGFTVSTEIFIARRRGGG